VRLGRDEVNGTLEANFNDAHLHCTVPVVDGTPSCLELPVVGAQVGNTIL